MEGLNQTSADDEAGRFDEVAGADLAAVGAFHAQHVEASIGAYDGKTGGAGLHDLTELAADALWRLGRDRLGFEDLQRLPIERRPRAGRRIAAPNQRIDLSPRFAPIDPGRFR